MRTFILIIVMGFAPSVSSAFEHQTTGFISQSALHTSDNNFFGRTDDSISFDYASAAMMSRISNDRWSFSTQLLSRHASTSDDGRPRFDYAFLTVNIRNNSTFNDKLEFGRTKAIYGMYNETRDAPFTTPSIFLAQSTYAEANRSIVFLADGVKYKLEHNDALNNLTFKAFAGRSIPNAIETENNLGYSFHGKLLATPSYQAGLFYDYNVGLLRLAITAGSINFKFHPDSDELYVNGALNPLNLNGEAKTAFKAISIEYNPDPWSFSAEYLIGDHRYSGLSTLLNGEELRFTPINRYVQAIYRIDTIFICLRHDEVFTDKGDPYGREFEAESPEATYFGEPSFARYGIDNMIGISWTYSNKWLFRAEYHNIKGAKTIFYRENKDWAQVDKYWALTALQASYRF